MSPALQCRSLTARLIGLGSAMVLVTLSLSNHALAQYGYNSPRNQHDPGTADMQFGMHMMVPIWLKEPGVNPGFGMEGRLAWEFGGFAPEFYAGGMVNWVDVDVGFDRPRASFTEPLDTFWLGAGARYHVLNPTAVVPFVGAGAQINFWNGMLLEDALVLDQRYRPTFGLKATLGVAFELSARFALEVGVDGVFALHGNVFDRNPVYLAPFMGGTFYF